MGPVARARARCPRARKVILIIVIGGGVVSVVGAVVVAVVVARVVAIVVVVVGGTIVIVVVVVVDVAVVGVVVYVECIRSLIGKIQNIDDLKLTHSKSAVEHALSCCGPSAPSCLELTISTRNSKNEIAPKMAGKPANNFEISMTILKHCHQCSNRGSTSSSHGVWNSSVCCRLSMIVNQPEVLNHS